MNTVPGLPDNVTAYKRTPTFDQYTLPAGLRREHRTKAGVWALIHVQEGSLRYRVLDPPGEEILVPGKPGVVRPEQPHEVEPLGAIRMFVEFFTVRPVQGGPHTTQVL